MENLILISTIIAIHIFAWLTPGPLFILIVRNALVYSRKTGIWTAVGIAIGSVIHITSSVAGISLMISTSVMAFNVIKFLGVGYLTYLGVKTLLFKINTQQAGTLVGHKDISPFHAIKIGFLAIILSPKAWLFFISIFATVFSSGAPFWVVAFLVIAMVLNEFVMASILSIFFTQKTIKSVYSKYQSSLNKCLGVAFIFLAGMIAFQ